MKGPLIQSKSARYTWLQVLTLAISGAAFLMNNMLVAIVMLFLATLFGIVAMMARVTQAQQMRQQPPNRHRR